MIRQLFRTERFKKDLKRLPHDVQERVGKALGTLIENPKHPSLQIKKMESASDIWEIRVTDNYRITFQFVKEGVLLRHVGTHNILRQP